MTVVTNSPWAPLTEHRQDVDEHFVAPVALRFKNAMSRIQAEHQRSTLKERLHDLTS